MRSIRVALALWMGLIGFSGNALCADQEIDEAIEQAADLESQGPVEEAKKLEKKLKAKKSIAELGDKELQGASVEAARSVVEDKLVVEYQNQ